jgi:hypothetical protein
MKSSRLAALILTATLLIALVGCADAGAPYIRSVDFSKDPVIPDQNFDIKVKVRNVDSSMEVWIYVDEETMPFKRINVGPTTEEASVDVLKDDWGVKFNWKCGTHTLKADLVKSGRVYHTLYMEFNVGNVPLIEFQPARPIPGSEVKVYLKDRESGDSISQLKVEISFQGEDREPSSYNTDTAGYFKFTPSKPGRYKMAIDVKKGYCGEMYFYAKRNMLVDGPHPENPMVDDMITVAVPSGDIGVRVYKANGDFYLAARTLITGAVNFTINDPGDYKLVIGDTSTRYWGINKSITVSARPLLDVTIEPATPKVKEPVVITVKAGGNPLSNAKVKIITPQGVQREYATLANGKVIYDGVSTMGEYTVIVETQKYEQVMKDFKARNGFQLELDPQEPLINNLVTLYVKDQDGIIVPDAEVSIPDAEIVGATDSEGRFEFTLREQNPDADPPSYMLRVMKDMYWDLSQALQTQDTLEIRSPTTVEVGGDVNVKVYNSRGGVVGDDTVSVKVTAPDNTISTLNKADFTFKPATVGSYTIDATKDRYTAASGSIETRPHPLFLEARIDGRQLLITAKSHNDTVEGLSAAVGMPDGRVIQVTTDKDGVAKVLIEGEGGVNITVNDRDSNQLYDTSSTARYIKKSYRISLLSIVTLLIAAGALFTAFVVWYFRTLPHRSDKERFEAKPGRSRLSGL